METILKAHKPETKSSLDKFKSIVEEIGKKETHRKVTLKYQSCCGCGCKWIEVERIVPFDSVLNDDDIITNVEKTDKILW